MGEVGSGVEVVNERIYTEIERDLNGRCSVVMGVQDFFATDHAAARLLEDEIEKRGLQEQYVTALIAELSLFIIAVADDLHINPLIPPLEMTGKYKEIGNAFLWALMRATPEQKAKAFLEAVGE